MEPKVATIVVDADACPVKKEIVETARRFAIPVLMVASFDHYLQPEAGVRIVQVDRSDQSVDLYISNHVKRGDIVITQDFGLATIALAKGAISLSNRGQSYDDEMMDFLLERRHEQAKRRRAGGRTKGPKALTPEDRSRFQQKLTKVLLQRQEIDEL
ncbi:YaiI/YqxD family protein [Paenibacillus pinihumi]|uniref:YaiI/YqxD family protein n=1 Tax=Paenibacillus pinihumi TaxID=669462 RepID=UPI001FE18DF3|nr:YaiI/YqxD family protein [Paenibacillus pinihumi]